MYNVEDLSASFIALSKEEKHRLFTLMTENLDIFGKIFPGMPLLLHILDEDNGVHPAYHGPVICAYKDWKAETQPPADQQG